MQWKEVTIHTTREGLEPLSAVLLEAGITGLQIEDDDEFQEYLKEDSIYWDYVEEDLLNKPKEDTKVKVYVSDNPYGEEILLNIKGAIANLKSIESSLNINLGTLELTTLENLNDEEWLNKWKEFYKPFEIGEKLIIKPSWEDVSNPNNKIIFTINPGNVFGTGLHQTTKLCIINLEKYITSESVVLDLGCGTGILSIISLLLGAKSGFAVDIDENAVDFAYSNAKLNGISKDNYFVTSGNIMTDENLKSQISTKKYDVICANIIADVICNISPFVATQLKDDGVFISSGIIKDRVEDVYDALNQNSLTPIDTIILDEWVCVIAKLKH
ncbi:MAG: 50S ribosomal protein L11 methyltransferase [bacterium]